MMSRILRSDNISKKNLTYKETHQLIDNQLYKLCNICYKWFLCNDEYFYKNKLNKDDGLYPYCKKCAKQKAYNWAVNNREKSREFHKKDDSKPKNRIRIRNLSKKARLEGKQKEWRQQNKDKVKTYNQKRQHKKHDITEEQWEACKNYFNYECAYCGISEKEAKMIYKQNLHKEHTDNFGSNDLSNCIPACRSCNSQKWKYKFDDWYNENNKKYSKERYNKIIRWLEEDYKNF